MHPRAQQLLDAHVEHVLARLEPASLQPRFEAGIERFLALAGPMTLVEAVSADQVKETAHRYAIEMQFGAAIPEQVGAVARRLYRHKALDRTRLTDLLPDSFFEEFLDKALELDRIQRALVTESVSNPIYSNVISDLLYAGVREFVAGIRFPGSRSAARVGKAISRRARPELGEELEEKLRQFIETGTRARLRASEKKFQEAVASDRFRDLLLDLWDDNKQRAVADLRKYMGSRDVEEFFVIGYECYQHLRRTPFFRDMLDAGIDTFFHHYGDTPLQVLLDDIGVTREMMLAEALHYAPPILARLRETGVLEALVRSELEEFYASGRVAEILE